LHVSGNARITGNVGIGTANPSQKLHVNGNSYITGNVGIGIANPQSKLDVNGTISAKKVLLTERVAAPEGFFETVWIWNNLIANKSVWTRIVKTDTIKTRVINLESFFDSCAINVILYENYQKAISVIDKFTDTEVFAINGKGEVSAAQGAFTIDSNGEVYGAQNASFSGKLKAKEIQLTLTGWPDYVFEEDYPLMSLQETEAFITQNKHLPNVPTAAEIEAIGVNLGEMNAILIQKIEELTLYIIQLEKRISEVENKKGGE
jgi:hypothetical protein